MPLSGTTHATAADGFGTVPSMQHRTAASDRLVLAGRRGRLDSAVEDALAQLGPEYQLTSARTLPDGQRLLRFGRRSAS